MKSSENGEMLNIRRVFILGSSLLTDIIMRILDEDQRIMVLGCATTVDEALMALRGHVIDAFIVMGINNQATMRVCPVLAQYPDVPILRADISQNQMQLVTSQNIQADPENLLAALATLPRRA